MTDLPPATERSFPMICISKSSIWKRGKWACARLSPPNRSVWLKRLEHFAHPSPRSRASPLWRVPKPSAWERANPQFGNEEGFFVKRDQPRTFEIELPLMP